MGAVYLTSNFWFESKSLVKVAAELFGFLGQEGK